MKNKRMKKIIICSVLAATLMLSASSCGRAVYPSPRASSVSVMSVSGGEELSSAEMDGVSADDADIDLTGRSQDVIYGELWNMLLMPKDYIGKKVIIKGTYSVINDGSAEYRTVTVKDSAGCCSQNLEIVLKDDSEEKKTAYLQPGTEITVLGSFGTCIKSGSAYARLNDAVLIS